MGSRLAAQGKNGRAAKDEIVFFFNPRILVSLEGNKKVMKQNGCERYV